MSGFFPEEEVKNQSADEPWKRSETDRMLDSYFGGAHPNRIAQELGRNPKAVKRRLEQFTYNERDRAERYEPFRRLSRKGKKWTENERVMLRSYQEKKIPLEFLAKVLQRDVAEVKGTKIGAAIETMSHRTIAPTIDLLWAYRYAYFGWKEPLISDEAYDVLVKEEIEFGGGEKAFAYIKSYQGWPNYVKTLALYLAEKHKRGKDES